MPDLSDIFADNKDNPSRFISGYADLDGDTKQFLADNAVYLDDDDVARCAPDFDIEKHLDQLDQILSGYRTLREIYHEKMRYYKGDHTVIRNRKKVKGGLSNTDNKVIVNIAKNLVNTFTGYTNGKPVKITYTPKGGESTSTAGQSVNDSISGIFNRVHADALIYDASKKAAIYGRSYFVAYKSQQFGDDKPQMRFNVRTPENCLLVYSNDNDSKPMFAMTFDYIDSNYYGTLYTPKHIAQFSSKILSGIASGSITNLQLDDLPFVGIPVIEIRENDERMGMIDDVLTLTDKLDQVMSAKIDENDYFNNAILLTKGIKQFSKDQKEEIRKYHVLQVESVDGQQEPEIEFLDKPDGDNIQEHTLTHLTNYIYTTAQVVNMSDPAFGDSTSSGDALARKMQPMQMHATVKYYQLTQALQELLLLIFTDGGDNPQVALDKIQHTSIKFTPNVPESLLDESTVVKNLNGIVSLPTLIGMISSIDNVPQEVDAIQTEKDANAQRFASAGTPPDDNNEPAPPANGNQPPKPSGD